MKVLSVLRDPDVVKKILGHLGLEAVAPSLVPARPDWSSWDGYEDADPYGPIADEDWGRPTAPP